MKVGFSGTRTGMTTAQKHELRVQLDMLGATELHHGDCQGADEQAHLIGRTVGLHIVGHPPKAPGLRAFCVCDEIRDPQEYLARNHAIVLETTMVLATPEGPPRTRSGTWATVRFAQHLRLPCRVISPDGSVESYE